MERSAWVAITLAVVAAVALLVVRRRIADWGRRLWERYPQLAGGAGVPPVPASDTSPAASIQDALLRKYHTEGLGQARVSFSFSIGIACLGFGVIVVSLFQDSLVAEREQWAEASRQVSALDSDIKQSDLDAQAAGKAAAASKMVVVEKESGLQTALADREDVLRAERTHREKYGAQRLAATADAPDAIGKGITTGMTVAETKEMLWTQQLDVIELLAKPAYSWLAKAGGVDPKAPAPGPRHPDATPWWQRQDIGDLKVLLDHPLGADFAASHRQLGTAEPARFLEGTDPKGKLTAAQVANAQNQLRHLSNIAHGFVSVSLRARESSDTELKAILSRLEPARQEVERAEHALRVAQAAYNADGTREREVSDRIAAKQKARAQAVADVRKVEQKIADLRQSQSTAAGTTIKTITGAVIMAVGGLFFVQSKRAQKQMGDFFLTLCAEQQQKREAEAAVAGQNKAWEVATKVSDPVLRARLEVAMALGLSPRTASQDTLETVLSARPPAPDRSHKGGDVQRPVPSGNGAPAPGRAEGGRGTSR